jgi:hypothetical protein
VSYDVYIVLHPFRALVHEFAETIRPVAECECEQLTGVEGYYCEAIDSAILNLRFRVDFVSLLGSRRVIELVSRWGRPVIAPAELAEDERTRFFLDHLSRYSTYVQQYPNRDEGRPMLLRVLDSVAAHVVPAPMISRPARWARAESSV